MTLYICRCVVMMSIQFCRAAATNEQNIIIGLENRVK